MIGGDELIVAPTRASVWAATSLISLPLPPILPSLTASEGVFPGTGRGDTGGDRPRGPGEPERTTIRVEDTIPMEYERWMIVESIGTEDSAAG